MERVRELLAQQNIEITDGAIDTLEQYMDEILALNESINLTAITDRDVFVQKHYVDSLLAAGREEVLTAQKIIDLGTGAGFPGIPLAVCFPEKEFVLIDSLNKRIKIIQDLCQKLEISNVTAIHGRAEELARRKDLREQFDVCVSRAVANLSTLAEYCLPFVKQTGTFIAYKGPDCGDEVSDAAKAIALMGGGHTEIVTPNIDGVPFAHTLVIIDKEKQTPKAYPRKAGTPTKKPIR